MKIDGIYTPFTHFLQNNHYLCNTLADKMENMQFTAIVLMALLTFKLLMLPSKVAINPMVNKARILMTGSIILLGVQFLLQYIWQLRAMGVSQAVMLNLFLFIPASWMLSMAVLNLQGKGRLKPLDRWIGGITWLLCTLLLSIAAAIDGEPLLSDTREIQIAEIIGSILYAAMQGHYAWRHTINLHAMRNALQNYYDRDMEGMLTWMQLSIIILVVLALMVPVLIFGTGPWLAIYGIIFFSSIFYMVDSFCSYVVSSASHRMEEAEENENIKKTAITEATVEVSEDQIKRMDRIVDQWVKDKCYLKRDLKLPVAATSLGIPQYQLSVWLRNKNLKYSEWITTLRIEEAKRVLLEHPDWTSEAVADHCGFNSREYFHRIFRSNMGMTPVSFQQNNGVINK